MKSKDKETTEDPKIFDKIQREKQINKEIATLKKIYKDIPENKAKIALNLIQEAAFMKVSLISLKDQINQDGPIDLFEQGDNSYWRESPAMKAYNTMIQRYTAVITKLIDILPAGGDKPKTDELLKFVKG